VWGGVGVAGILDDPINYLLQLLISGVLEELLLQPALVELDEAFHALALSHHHYQFDYLFFVLPQVFESQEEQQLEVLEDVRILSLHQFDVVLREFEGRPLEVHVAWGAGEHEAEVDVYDVPVDINKDVVIVPILDIEEVLDETVAC